MVCLGFFGEGTDHMAGLFFLSACAYGPKLIARGVFFGPPFQMVII